MHESQRYEGRRVFGYTGPLGTAEKSFLPASHHFLAGSIAGLCARVASDAAVWTQDKYWRYIWFLPESVITMTRKEYMHRTLLRTLRVAPMVGIKFAAFEAFRPQEPTAKNRWWFLHGALAGSAGVASVYPAVRAADELARAGMVVTPIAVLRRAMDTIRENVMAGLAHPTTEPGFQNVLRSKATGLFKTTLPGVYRGAWPMFLGSMVFDASAFFWYMRIQRKRVLDDDDQFLDRMILWDGLMAGALAFGIGYSVHNWKKAMMALPVHERLPYLKYANQRAVDAGFIILPNFAKLMKSPNLKNALGGLVSAMVFVGTQFYVYEKVKKWMQNRKAPVVLASTESPHAITTVKAMKERKRELEVIGPGKGHTITGTITDDEVIEEELDFLQEEQ